MQFVPYISVQPNWDTLIRDNPGRGEEKEPFWVSLYKKGKTSLHADEVRLLRNNKSNSISVESTKLTVEQVNSRCFKVECPDWDLNNVVILAPKTEFTPLKTKAVACIDVTSDDALYATGNGTYIVIGNLQDGKTQRILKGHVGDLTTVRFFPSNQVLLSGASDFQVKIWSVLDGSNPVTLKGHTSAITDTAIISRGRNVLTSSKDGTIRLWHCGSASTIAVLCRYDCPINKIILTTLPDGYEKVAQESLDEREVETADKMVIAALGDGSVRGIHLGTKKEILTTPSKSTPLTAVAYDETLGVIITGDSNGVVEVFAKGNFSQPQLLWQRNEHAITGLLIRLDAQGDRSLLVAGADGSIYQTDTIASLLNAEHTVRLQTEYTGIDLDPVYGIVTTHNHETPRPQRVVCGARDGVVRIY